MTKRGTSPCSSLGAVYLAIIGCSLALLSGCVRSSGGWDVEALVEAEPGLGRIPGQRLGDMTPFPAVSGGRLWLVVCRWPGDRPVRVHGGGVGWPREWALKAVSAVDQAVGAVELVFEDDVSNSGLAAAPGIEVRLVSAMEEDGPHGLGDTLTDCDVSRTGTSPFAIRGWVSRAEIRMRRSQRIHGSILRTATDAEWVGALMHEMGHALGFAGHVAAGESLVVLEESRLRGLGRNALVGDPVKDPTLAALYQVPAGRVLGEASITERRRNDLMAVEDLVSKWEARWGKAEGPIANVGDREARIQWRWPAEGCLLELTFPKWRKELGSGSPITVVPSPATRRALLADVQAGSSPGNRGGPPRREVDPPCSLPVIDSW